MSIYEKVLKPCTTDGTEDIESIIVPKTMLYDVST